MPNRVRPGGALNATLMLSALAIATTACAGPPPRDPASVACDSGATGRQFATLDAAAVEALANAYRGARSWERRRMHAGTVRRREDGYVWCAPQRSSRSADSIGGPSIALGLRDTDAAVYLMHPRPRAGVSGCLDDGPTDADWRAAEALDANGRPLYLLTGSRQIWRLSASAGARFVARLGAHGDLSLAEPPAMAEIAALSCVPERD